MSKAITTLPTQAAAELFARNELTIFGGGRIVPGSANGTPVYRVYVTDYVYRLWHLRRWDAKKQQARS